MKRTVLFAFILFALSISAFGQKAAVGKPADASTGVRDAFDRLVDGIRQVDADKVLAAYDKSERLLIFNNNGTATLGYDNVKANVDATYARIKNVTLEITGLRVEMLGKTNAYVSCKWIQGQEFDGKLETSSGRMTLIYKLVGKDWKITHRHTSPDRPDATRPVFPSERQ
ncbi:MAG: nuclear transport factor 2 family protein [Acidobacteria bacterium]|nr:nuclear transport factor 2 family protein [Acidobacteriota bacterium]MBK9528231.1 nuclear transport factor 2 family protein [Acidobacteriota bacterium]MBP9110863.1 nuclear transport factor 2 family protein [Pyrinomonadaceae bacterium]